MIRGVKKKTRAAWEKCSFGDLPPRKKNPLGDKERNRRKKDKCDLVRVYFATLDFIIDVGPTPQKKKPPRRREKCTFGEAPRKKNPSGV